MRKLDGWIRASALWLCRHGLVLQLTTWLVGFTGVLLDLLWIGGQFVYCAGAAVAIAGLATILALHIALGGKSGRIRSTTLRLMAAIAILAPLYALPLYFWRESEREICRTAVRHYLGVAARMEILADSPGDWIDKYRDALRKRADLARWKGRQYEGGSDHDAVKQRIQRDGPDQTDLDRSWSRFEAEAKSRGLTIPSR